MQGKDPSGRLINYKAMRLVIGAIAFLLSPVVWALSGEDTLRSVSSSYWTDSRDIFVGSLIAVGFFMSAYNGSGNRRDWEYWLSKVACVCAVLVALFPTKGIYDADTAACWILAITPTPKTVHYAAAILLFLCLIALLWFFSWRAKRKGSIGRSRLYRAVSIAMVAGMVCVYLLTGSLFWLEAWGLTFFGIGWLIAGGYSSGSSDAAAGHPLVAGNR